MESPKIEIDYLANHRQFAEKLAHFSWQHWRWIYERRSQSFEDALTNYLERANTDCLPLALIALVHGELVGTASLKNQDLEIRPQLTPCLGGVYVIPEWRRCGVATRLIGRVVEEARKLNLTTLYLWTESSAAEGLYRKLGWRVIERLEYAETPIVTMALEPCDRSEQ